MKFSAALLAVGMIGVANASTITLVSGNLSVNIPGDGTNTTSIPSGSSGTFNANRTQTDGVFLPDRTGRQETVASGSATAQITDDGLTINAVAAGSTYFQYPSGRMLISRAAVQGALTFEVSGITMFDYRSRSLFGSSETITNAQGTTII